MDLSRVPDTVEELIEQVKESCKVAGGIRLQYKDVDFGGTFVNLNSTSMIKDLTTIKVIPSATETLLLEFVESDLDTSSISTHTDDTVILSSSSSEKLRTEPWPKEFNIPQFSFETEGQLEKGNAEYTKDQTRLTPTSKMLSDILERLAEKIFSYKAYPSDADLSDVAEALTRKHPCLRQPDPFNESYGWKLRLKTKMSNYRTQLKSHGLASELLVNTLKSKSREDPVPKPAKNNKKARRGEANYYPQTSSEKRRETMRKLYERRWPGPSNSGGKRLWIRSLTSRTSWKDGQVYFRWKRYNFNFFVLMPFIIVWKWEIYVLTFSCWKLVFKKMYCTLSTHVQINAEFLRVTAVPLLTRFMAQLDKHSPQLLKIIRKKGGTTKAKTAIILEFLDQVGCI